MNDDRIEPTLDSLDDNDKKKDKDETPSLDISLDEKNNKNIDDFSLEYDALKASDDEQEDVSVKIIPDRGTPRNDENEHKTGSKDSDLFDNEIEPVIEKKDPDPFDDNAAPIIGNKSSSPFNQEINDRENYSGTKQHRTSSFSPITGRIDRFHASLLLIASSLLCMLLITYFDAIVYFVLNNTSGAVNNNGYQIENPLIYIGIGAGLWLFSLLIIAMGRLRDIGRSPLFAILLYAPPLTFWIIYLSVLPGTPDSNKYGPANTGYGIKTWIMAGLVIGLLPFLIYINWENASNYLEGIVLRFHQQ